MGNKNIKLDVNSVACSTLSKHRGGIQMVGSELNCTLVENGGKTRGDWHDSKGTSSSSSPFALLPPLVPPARPTSISPALFYLNAWNRLRIAMLRILQPMNKTCLVTNQVVEGSREWLCFLQENLFMLCVSAAHGKLILCSKWCNTRVWCDSHSILSSQMSVFTQLATTWFF